MHCINGKIYTETKASGSNTIELHGTMELEEEQ